MNNWPQRIEGNEFGLAKLDPDRPLKLKVVTWSSVFSDGGSVAIEGYDEDGKKHYSDFGRIGKKTNGSVRDEVRHLQDVVDDFNADLDVNWHNLISEARKNVMEHWEKEAKDARSKLAKARKGVFA